MTRVSCFLVLAVVGSALAQTSQPEKITVVRLTIHPAAEAQPALKYQLLPPILDQTPGNAALLYDTAIQMTGALRYETNDKYLRNLLDTPLDKLPSQKTVQDRLDFGGAARYVAMAARREKCDWDRPMSEGPDILLPELGGIRNIAKYVVLQARCQLAKGELDAAIYSLQTGFSLARHSAEGLCLITDLVGMAIGRLMASGVEEFVQAPGAPNLYWALTSLPNPFIDIRQAIRQESLFVYRVAPFLTELETRPPTQQEYRALLDKMAMLKVSNSTGQVPSSVPQQLVAEIESGIKADYAEAKRYLVSHGRAAKVVDAMPVSQAVLLYYLRTFEQARDDVYKWVNVPYWQGYEEAQRAEKRSRDLETQMKNNLFLQVLASCETAYLSTTKVDRQIAMLRCIEALRMYAANHGNTLPKSLAEVTDVPIPMDPVTGRAFAYSVAENKAVLEAAARSGRPASEGRRYEITLVSP